MTLGFFPFLIKFSISASALIFLVNYLFECIIHQNDPPTAGCINDSKHKWELIKDNRGYAGYVSWSRSKVFKCKKCNKEIENEEGVW